MQLSHLRRAKKRAGNPDAIGNNRNSPNQERLPVKRARFIPAQVKTAPNDRPPACPRCGCFELVKRRMRRQAGHRPLRGYGQSPQILLHWSCRTWSRRRVAPPARGIAPSKIRPDLSNRIWDGYGRRPSPKAEPIYATLPPKRHTAERKEGAIPCS